MNTLVASEIMNTSIHIVHGTIRKWGKSYPVLSVAFDEDTELDIKHEIIVKKGRLEKVSSTSDDSCIWIIGTSVEDVKHHEAIEYLSKKIAREYKPNMMGYTSVCYYRYSKDDSRETILNDPDTIKIVASTFYLSKYSYPMVNEAPFLSHVVMEENDEVWSEHPFTDESRDDTLICHSGWSPKMLFETVSFKNPYKYE